MMYMQVMDLTTTPPKLLGFVEVPDSAVARDVWQFELKSQYDHTQLGTYATTEDIETLTLPIQWVGKGTNQWRVMSADGRSIETINRIRYFKPRGSTK